MKLFILAALPALVAAQYGAPAGPATSSSAAPSSTAPAAAPSLLPGQHLIEVGPSNNVTFSPQSITANVNDTVIFHFNEVDGSIMHSVTQSSLANPCELVPGGFASGFQAAGNVFSITITNASKPIWFYCTQTSPAKHCNLGMVGAINSPNGTVFSNFAAAALSASDPVQTASGILTGVGAVATAPAGTPSAATATPSSGAGRLIAGAGSLLAGLLAVVYTLA